MKKSILFCVVILCLLFLSACQLQSGLQPKDSQMFSQRSGSEGLRINFLENLPPQQLFDNEEFNAVIQVENQGSSDVGGAGDKIYLSGFDQSIITGISNFGMSVPRLRGKDLFTQNIDVELVSFKGGINLLKNKGLNQFNTPLMLTTCYEYTTLASPQICVDPNPLAPSLKPKVCTAQTVGAGTQGAPIAVSSVDVLPSPGNTKFKIYVQNVGGGRVLRSGMSALSECSPFFPNTQQLFKDVDYVEVQDVIVSDVSIKNSCRPLDDNHLRLQNGQGVFYCEFNRIRGTSAYPTPLIVKLRYNYQTTLLKNLNIYSSS